jgi:hypothetical protein
MGHVLWLKITDPEVKGTMKEIWYLIHLDITLRTIRTIALAIIHNFQVFHQDMYSQIIQIQLHLFLKYRASTNAIYVMHHMMTRKC